MALRVTPEGTITSLSSCASIIPTRRNYPSPPRLPKAPVFIRPKYTQPHTSFLSDASSHSSSSSSSQSSSPSLPLVHLESPRTYDFDDDFPSIAASESTFPSNPPPRHSHRSLRPVGNPLTPSPSSPYSTISPHSSAYTPRSTTSPRSASVSRTRKSIRSDHLPSRSKDPKRSRDPQFTPHRLPRGKTYDYNSEFPCIPSDPAQSTFKEDTVHFTRHQPTSFASDRHSFASSIKRRISLHRQPSFARRCHVDHSIQNDWNNSKSKMRRRKSNPENSSLLSENPGCAGLLASWFGTKEKKTVVTPPSFKCTAVVPEKTREEVQFITMLAYDDFMHSPRPSPVSRIFSKLRRT